jgi:hypothetical protein
MNPLPRPGLALRLGAPLFAGALLTLSASAHAGKTPTYAITKAKVVTVSGAVLENATVVLRDGLVVDIGPSAVIPKDARVFDGTGLTVTPGLIDAWSGAGMPAARPAGGGGGGGAAGGAATPPPPTPSLLLPTSMSACARPKRSARAMAASPQSFRCRERASCSGPRR